jgi:ABC-type glycerol-3-phosphate transport system substrate-binding protein
MIETGEQLTLDSSGDGKIDRYGLDVGHSSPWTYTRLWGQDLVSDEDYASGLLHQWQTDKPEVYDALVGGLQARADAIYEDKVTPSPETASALSQIGDVLKTGAVAMNFTGGWALWGDLPEEFDFRYAINPLGGTGGSGTRVENTWVDPVQISSQSKFPDAAWAFTKFLVSDVDGLQIQIKARSVIPAVKSAFEPYMAEYSGRLAMTEDEQRTFLTGCLDQAKTTVPCHILVGWAAIRDIFNAELELVWLGERTAKEAVDVMIPKVNTKLEENLKELNLT